MSEDAAPAMISATCSSEQKCNCTGVAGGGVGGGDGGGGDGGCAGGGDGGGVGGASGGGDGGADGDAHDVDVHTYKLSC